jgi:hypothetical protein
VSAPPHAHFGCRAAGRSDGAVDSSTTCLGCLRALALAGPLAARCTCARLKNGMVLAGYFCRKSTRVHTHAHKYTLTRTQSFFSLSLSLSLSLSCTHTHTQTFCAEAESAMPRVGKSSAVGSCSSALAGVLGPSPAACAAEACPLTDARVRGALSSREPGRGGLPRLNIPRPRPTPAAAGAARMLSPALKFIPLPAVLMGCAATGAGFGRAASAANERATDWPDGVVLERVWLETVAG